MCQVKAALAVVGILAFVFAMHRLLSNKPFAHWLLSDHRPNGPEFIKKCIITDQLVGLCSCGKYIKLQEGVGWKVDELESFSLRDAYPVDAVAFEMLKQKVAEISPCLS